MHQKKYIVVLGKVCSGKDTFAKTLVNHTQIDIGNIVRSLKKDTTRVHDKDLDKKIIEELSYALTCHSANDMNFVITGIRQMSIVDYLLNNLDLNQLEIIWLEVSKEELKRRFINRASSKDQTFTFEEILQKDDELGLKEVEEFVKTTRLTKIITNE